MDIEEQPLVSVILTSYNHERFIGESIKSILNQTYSNIELAIVDDCSTDNSWQIIQDYAKQDNRIISYRTPVNLFCGTIEAMLPKTRGSFVAIAHSDDAWLPTKLEKQVKYLIDNPDVEACFTRAEIINDDGVSLADDPKKVDHPYLHAFDYANRSRVEWLRFLFLNGNAFCHPSILIRRHCYVDFDMFPHGLTSLPDYRQWVRLCLHGDVYILDERLTRFRVHDDESNTSGISLDREKRLNEEFYLVLKEYSQINREDLLAAFPETEKYLIAGRINTKFALAKICLEDSLRPQHHLFGIELLYELFQSKESSAEILDLYGYENHAFDDDRRRFDIFGLIPGDRCCSPGVYVDCTGRGFSETNSIHTKTLLTDEGFGVVKFDLGELASGASNLRFDPDEGRLDDIEILDCRIDDAHVTLNAVNPFNDESERYRFITTDPQFITAKPVSGRWLTVLFRVQPIGTDELSRLLISQNEQIGFLSKESSRAEKKGIGAKLRHIFDRN